MNDKELKELQTLFSLSRDAVLCVQRGTVLYANAAAKALFPGCVGTPASRWLPDYILGARGTALSVP